MKGDITRLANYLQAQEIDGPKSGVTRRWTVHSGNVPHGQVGEPLCTVSWYAPWRRYCVEVDHGIVLDVECLTALATFVDRRTREHKAQRVAAR